MANSKNSAGGTTAGAPAPAVAIGLAELEAELVGLRIQQQQARADMQEASDRAQAIGGAIQVVEALKKKLAPVEPPAAK